MTGTAHQAVTEAAHLAVDLSRRSTPVNAAEILLLEQIRDELRALPAAIAAAIDRQHQVPRRLAPADEKALAALLPVIATAVGNRTFSVRELHEYAKLNIESAIALRAALAAIGGTRKIGWLLRRGNNVDIGGYRIVAVGHSREGRLLSVIPISRETRQDG